MNARRLWLLRATKVLALIGLALAVYPFIAGLLPDAGVADQRLLQWQREVDLTDIKVGEWRLIEDWPGGPVAIYHRSRHELDGLPRVTAALAAAPADHQRSQQPAWFVFHPVTTRGCQVRPLPAHKQPKPDIPWYGGFIDPCSGALYDSAGRLYRGAAGPTGQDLAVPNYRMLGESRLQLLPPRAP